MKTRTRGQWGHLRLKQWTPTSAQVSKATLTLEPQIQCECQRDKGQRWKENLAGDVLTSEASWISKSMSQPEKRRGSELGGKSGLQKHIINSNNIQPDIIIELSYNTMPASTVWMETV